MNRQLKTRIVGLSVLLAGALLGGCSTASHPSTAWQGRGYSPDNSGNTSALLYSPGLEDTTVLASTMSYTEAPEYGRRDFTLSTRDLSRRDELLGIRPEAHPSLNNRRTFRSSRQADEYSYPSDQGRGYYGYRNTPRYNAPRSNHGYGGR